MAREVVERSPMRENGPREGGTVRAPSLQDQRGRNAVRPFIVLGDKTDHGGVVIEASPTTDTHGKLIARLGDKVTCPKKGHGPTVIVTGDPTMLIDGKPAARHGDKCACGATLIASQAVSSVDDGSGGGGAGQVARQASAAAELAAQARALFDEQVQIENVVFAVGLPYFIKVDGREYSGRIGADGRLPRVDTPTAGLYELLVGDEALAHMEGLDA